MLISRRKLLQLGVPYALGSVAGALPMHFAQAGDNSFIPPTSTNTPPARLVLVLLRGAYDGLSAFYPNSDPSYKLLRPNISLGQELDSENAPSYVLDSDFSLHPSLSSLIPSWERKSFTFIPCTGLAKPYRSHFEAQHFIELGQDNITSSADGWLNKLASLNANSRLIGIGEANPEILRGTTPSQIVPSGNAALQTGVLANQHNRKVLEELYARDGELSSIFIKGENSRMSTAMSLNEARMSGNAEMMMADKDAAPPSALLQDSHYLVTLMLQNPDLRFGFLSAGGWDTHANQGREKGQLANNLRNLADSLAYLQSKFTSPNDVIVVMSEFGRTVRENASRGTDHGFGNAMMVMGPRVNGGQRHGRWEGLSQEKLNESRDLPVFHDYRQVLSLLLRDLFNLDKKQIEQVFPAFDVQNCLRCDSAKSITSLIV